MLCSLPPLTALDSAHPPSLLTPGDNLQMAMSIRPEAAQLSTACSSFAAPTPPSAAERGKTNAHGRTKSGAHTNGAAHNLSQTWRPSDSNPAVLILGASGRHGALPKPATGSLAGRSRITLDSL
mmetsp:Transcript_79341/g.116301  ORF Transcript_79341/g.116301 Transcript_79341/m.116301 type:complete len:124 (-) Transcript_79341:741-1112(-)